MFDPNTKILVVDDAVTMRKVVINYCIEFGFKNVVEASDGSRAWEALIKASPPIDLIISDWKMPHSTGLDFLKKVRADAKYKDLPFIMVTAEDEKRQVVDAIESGVSNYIVKPFNGPNLKAKIESVLSKRKKK